MVAIIFSLTVLVILFLLSCLLFESEGFLFKKYLNIILLTQFGKVGNWYLMLEWIHCFHNFSVYFNNCYTVSSFFKLSVFIKNVTIPSEIKVIQIALLRPKPKSYIIHLYSGRYGDHPLTLYKSVSPHILCKTNALLISNLH